MARLTRIYLALGSNLGDRLEYFQQTLEKLENLACVERVAPIYETEPWGITDQPRFLNTVVEAKSRLEPLDLLMMLKAVEMTLGRTKTIRNGPRVIDLDILLYGSQQVSLPQLEIPHPRLAERAFVLTPLADLAPTLRPPGWNLTIQQQLAALDRSGVKPFPAAFLKVKVQPAGASGKSARVTLPAGIGQLLGKPANRIPVRGRIQNVDFRSTISHTAEGTPILALDQQIRRAAEIKPGDDILLRLELDSQPRAVDIPADVQAALQAHDAAAVRFERLSYSHKKEFLDYINSAKTSATRTRRINQLLVKLTQNT